LMLSRMRDATEVGFYRAPTLVLEGLTLVPRVFGFGLIPTMAGLAALQPATVTALYRRACSYLLVVGLPIAAFGLLEGDPFIRLIFGPDYGPSGVATRILIPAAAFMFLSNFAETTLACIDHWRTIVVVSTFCLVLNVGLNLWWIPLHGFEGAAWATLLTEGAYFLLTAGAVHRHGHRVPWLALTWRPLLATLVFAAILWLCRDLGMIVASLLASLAWAAATVALGIWNDLLSQRR
jgi:O-antigen/teichoic acid export membrane protein